MNYIKNNRVVIFQIAVLMLSFLPLGKVLAQLNVCPGTDLVSTVSGANTTVPYRLTYFLVNSSNNVVATNTSGTFSTGSLSAGNYTVYAVNDDGNATLPSVSSAYSVTGTCYTQISRSAIVNNCSTITVCQGNNIISTVSGANTTAPYRLTYFLVNSSNTVVATNTNGTFATGSLSAGNYTVYAVNDDGNASLPVVSGLYSSLSGTCFTQVSRPAVINACNCFTVCEQRTLDVSVSGANTTSPYLVSYVLVCGGTVKQTNTSGSFNLTSLGVTASTNANNCTVYAVNHDGTATIATAGSAYSVTGACYTQTSKCVTVTPGSSNPSGTTSANSTTNNFPSCLGTPANAGTGFTSAVENTCVATDITPTSGLVVNNDGKGKGGHSVLRTCSGDLSFNSAPLIYAVQCDANGGALGISVDPLTTTSGTITRFEAALYGPVNSACPTVSGGSFVDCNDNTDGSAMALSTNAGPNEVYLVLIDTEGGTSTFSINGQNTALPVDLISFTGSIKDKHDELTWKTAAEVNVSHFELEYSRDGANFAKIGHTMANNSPSDYKVYNYNTIIGNNYYRLKMVDNDNSYKYSNIVVLQRKISKIQITDLVPNPTVAQVLVNIVSPVEGKMTLQIFDTNGKELTNNAYEVNEGNTSIQLDLKNYSKGMYLVQVLLNGQTSSAKIIKE